jgi:hypothetical protein
VLAYSPLVKYVAGRMASGLPSPSEREKLVVALYYYYENLTLREIGEVLGVTESRVSQLHTKAILRVPTLLGRDRFALALPFYPDGTPSLHAYPTPEQGWFCFGAAAAERSTTSQPKCGAWTRAVRSSSACTAGFVRRSAVGGRGRRLTR